jgi:hypothetical protein
VKVLTTAFIMVLLFSAAALFQFASVASANPMDGTPVPPAFQMPNEDPPKVTVQSPLNTTTYFENEVLLNFTVTKPDSWSKPHVVCYIKNITYQIDGEPSVILYTPTPPTLPSELPSTDQFSVVLNSVHEGQHTLQIKVLAESQYIPNDTYYWFMVRHYPLRVSQTIVFTVENSPTPTPTPEHSLIVDPNFSFYTGLTLLIIAVAAFAGLLVYFKKRKR